MGDVSNLSLSYGSGRLKNDVFEKQAQPFKSRFEFQQFYKERHLEARVKDEELRTVFNHIYKILRKLKKACPAAQPRRALYGALS